MDVEAILRQALQVLCRAEVEDIEEDLMMVLAYADLMQCSLEVEQTTSLKASTNGTIFNVASDIVKETPTPILDLGYSDTSDTEEDQQPSTARMEITTEPDKADNPTNDCEKSSPTETLVEIGTEGHHETSLEDTGPADVAGGISVEPSDDLPPSPIEFLTRKKTPEDLASERS